ncbi:Fe-S protein, homolog of lactate dehydrogenase SO1521 [Olavius sp. associated proteobacterium Delta 1]|nr:Fe-S protein, homolog of lactate dehydrogenase SO1521 [Olavius sp. associated proteobacterium Delta 1]
MDLSQLNISGGWHNDAATLEKFSRDMSAYRILPALVVEPENEEDVFKTVTFARNEGLSIVSRSGGSDLSGASIGPGIILNFKKHLNRLTVLGEDTVVEPGMILANLVNQLNDHNLMLPAIPSSSAVCALGGNVGTRATGPKTAKYGTLDDFVTSLRFITARGEVVDTTQALPDYLATGLRQIQQKYLADETSREIVAGRPYIAGGYNLNAFDRYTAMGELAAHLLVGSIGTLGIVTEIRLKLMKQRPSKGTLVAHFRNYDEFTEASLRIKELDPAALEYSDASCCRLVNGKILNLEDPDIAATLVAEFDDSSDKVQTGREIIKAYDISRLWEFKAGSPEESSLWQDRRRILPSLLKYCRQNNLLLLPIIDDIAIHVKDFGPVIQDLTELMRRLNVEISFYGHAGFGSIHARPYFDPAGKNLKEQIETVSQESFNILQKYRGTLVGEHNAGRSRSVYLAQELGPAFEYLREIKNLFDPDDLLNPGTLFATEPISTHMDFTVR